MDKIEAEAVIRETIEYANKEIKRTKVHARRIVVTVIVVAAFVVLWMGAWLTDYVRVTTYNEPLFCISRDSVYNGAEDYRHCQGVGYSFEIVVDGARGRKAGLSRYTCFLFGNEICSAKRIVETD
ncbi:MAG: hypothetical protein MJ057_04525 [Sphaerochaetaceae bacterium]|nr:hypothetical protein [Sphaerochaetaceae bacterium]